jgi:hypothetical protein
MLVTTTKTHALTAMIPSHLPISCVRFSRGVFSCETVANSAAIFPNSVLNPVSVTTALPLP